MLFKHFILHLSELLRGSGRKQCQYQCKNTRGNRGPADNPVINGLRTSYNEVAWKNFSQHLAVACPVYTNKVLATKYHSGRGYQGFPTSAASTSSGSHAFLVYETEY